MHFNNSKFITVKKDIFKKVRQGDRFYTPKKILEKALIYRPKPNDKIYTDLLIWL